MSNRVTRMIERAAGRRSRERGGERHGRVTRDVHGFRMHLDLDDGGISRVIYNRGGREEAFMYVLDHEIEEGMVCMDLGANLGYATLIMCRRVGAGGFVYAVEPSAQNLSLLRPNIEDNHFSDRCEITQGLISDTTGEMSFWLSSRPNLGSVSRHQHSVSEVKLPSWSLPDFFEGRRPVDFIKMDVEGHEVEILRGGLEYFRSNSRPCKILLELHQGVYRAENPFDRVLRDYVDCGFHGRYLISTPTAQPPLFRDAGYAPKLIFYTDERQRGLYEGIADEDMIRLACNRSEDHKGTGRARALMLQRS